MLSIRAPFFVPRIIVSDFNDANLNAVPAHVKYGRPLRAVLPPLHCLDRCGIRHWLVSSLNASAHLTNENLMGGWLNRAINLWDQPTNELMPNISQWKRHTHSARPGSVYSAHADGIRLGTTAMDRIHSIPFVHKLKHNKVQNTLYHHNKYYFFSLTWKCMCFEYTRDKRKTKHRQQQQQRHQQPTDWRA